MKKKAKQDRAKITNKTKQNKTNKELSHLSYKQSDDTWSAKFCSEEQNKRTVETITTNATANCGLSSMFGTRTRVNSYLSIMFGT